MCVCVWRGGVEARLILSKYASFIGQGTANVGCIEYNHRRRIKTEAKTKVVATICYCFAQGQL